MGRASAFWSSGKLPETASHPSDGRDGGVTRLGKRGSGAQRGEEKTGTAVLEGNLVASIKQRMFISLLGGSNVTHG